MEIGTVFPQIEIGTDPDALVEYATRVEAAGYEHLLAFDHVLGVDPDKENWDGPYDNADVFHEPLTTFAHLAAHTEDLSFVTGILILPQRQTALVAKQAAQVDLLSDGRLRLGVGNGWNAKEYEALGQDFSRRGRRIGEQIEVLRRLWSEETVSFDGEFHDLPEVGINPRPDEGSIPIWLGGMADPVKRRVAQVGDGWIPQFQPGEDAEDHLADLEAYAEEAGRSMADIGLHGRVYAIPGEEDEWVERASAWDDLGADYLAIDTMYQDIDDTAGHVEHLERVATVLGDAGFDVGQA